MRVLDLYNPSVIVGKCSGMESEAVEYILPATVEVICLNVGDTHTSNFMNYILQIIRVISQFQADCCCGATESYIVIICGMRIGSIVTDYKEYTE